MTLPFSVPGRDTPFPESVPSGWCGMGGEREGIKGGRGEREVGRVRGKVVGREGGSES